MTAGHKKKPHAHDEAHAAAPDSTSALEERRRERLREIWLSFFASILITACMLVIKLVVEQTDFGKQIESMTYDLLQHHLYAAKSAPELPVIVLDISSIPMVTSHGLQPELITDREPLLDLVNRLTTMSPPPKAIGLDVDFSPDAHGYADPMDEKLLDTFANSKIPIRVGVNGSLSLGPENWLLKSGYKDLASCIIVPNPDNGESTRYIAEWLDVGYSRTPYSGVTARCPSMGVALATASVREVPPVADWLAETTRTRDDEQITKREFLVDYSPLDLLTQYADEHGDDITSDLSGKIVLLGRAKKTTDTFAVPGRPGQVFAGVFLHACAAFTILKRPLYHLTELGRIFLDVFFWAAIFGTVLGLRLYGYNHDKEEFLGHSLPDVLAWVVALGLVIAAVYFVRFTHLMWDDFILVTIVLVAHTPIEHITLGLYKGIAGSLHAPGKSTGTVSSSSSGGHSEGE